MTKQFCGLGVLGGMGPLATAHFLKALAEESPARCDQDHVPVLVFGDPRIPDRTNALLASAPSPLPMLQYGANVLARAGARALAIACNTAHAWVDQIRIEAPVRLLHVADAVLREFNADPSQNRKLGLLATRGTLAAAFYQDHLRRHFIEVVAPDETVQARVDDAIKLLKAGNLDSTGATFAEAFEHLQGRGVRRVALACTDIPVVFQHPQAIDTSRALARLAVDWWSASRAQEGDIHE